MNIKLNFNEQFNSIDVIYPINYSDRLDGLQDTISCEFYLNDDLLPYYHKHQKIVIDILDDENNILKEFRMCATDLNRELCSTYDKNSAYTYRYTLTACEPTVLINENIRTDIAITPYAYGTNTPYKTLWDAYCKVCSCHNLNNRNEPIYNKFTEYYKKWHFTRLDSSFDATHRTSEDNKYYIYGKLQGGTTSRTRKVNQQNANPPWKDTTVWTTTLPTIEFNNEIIEEFPVVKTYSVTVTKTETHIVEGAEPLDPVVTQTTEDITFTLSLENNIIKYEVTNESGLNWRNIDFYVEYKSDRDEIYNLLTSVPCPSLTYVDLSTYSQLEDIFARVGVIPYLDFDDQYRCFVTGYQMQGTYNNSSPIETLSNEEVARINDYTSNSVSTQVKNLVCDTESICFPSSYAANLYASNYPDEIPLGTMTSDEIENWQEGLYNINSVDEIETYKSLSILVPNTYDSGVAGILDPSSYFLELPSNIQSIDYLYYIDLENHKLRKINTNRIIEYSMWSNLPSLEQKHYAYFIRGENKIRNFIATLVSLNILENNWAWSETEGYKALRKSRFVCVYKPMINTTYIGYDYNTMHDKTTRNIDLGYKAVSDKQISNTLSYEFEKNVSNKISYKLVTRDINEVINHYAGQRVYYKTTKFRPEFEYELESGSIYDKYVGIEGITLNSWYKDTNNNYYTINPKTNRFEPYRGILCVITKMDVVINKSSIEVSFELNTNIAQNSVVSGYSDNVRVSDNLSTESVITREINLYKTFLLNCTSRKKDENTNATFNSCSFDDWLVDDGSKIFLNSNDNPLLMAALYATGAVPSNSTSDLVSYSNILLDMGIGYKADGLYVSTVGKEPVNEGTSTEIKYKTSLDPNGVLYTTRLSNYLDNLPRLYVTLTDDGDYIIDNVLGAVDNWRHINLEYFSSTTYQIIKDNISNFLNGTYYFRYTTSGWYSSSGPTLNLQVYTGSWTTLDTWNISGRWIDDDTTDSDNPPNNFAITFNQYSFKCNVLSPSNKNPYFITSNNMGTLSFVQSNPAVLGNWVTGYDGQTRWTKSQPLFAKYSYEVNYLDNLNCNRCILSLLNGRTQMLTVNFIDLIKDYGFTDVNIDIREKINVNIHYLVTENNLCDFYNKHKDFFDNNTSSFDFNISNIINIKELNKNFDWLSANVQRNTSNNISFSFKRIPKYLTMNEYLKNQALYPKYCGVSSVSLLPRELFDNTAHHQLTFNLRLTSSNDLTYENNIYNYLLYVENTDNDTETPLMILDTEGSTIPSNQIEITYFLI